MCFINNVKLLIASNDKRYTLKRVKYVAGGSIRCRNKEGSAITKESVVTGSTDEDALLKKLI